MITSHARRSVAALRRIFPEIGCVLLFGQATTHPGPSTVRACARVFSVPSTELRELWNRTVLSDRGSCARNSPLSSQYTVRPSQVYPQRSCVPYFAPFALVMKRFAIFPPTADDHDSVEQGHFPSCAGNLNRIQKHVFWQLASALISVARQTDIIVVSSNLTIRGGDDEHVVHLIKLESTQTHAHPRSSQSCIAAIVIRSKADN